MDESRIVEIYRRTVRPLYVTVAGWTGGDRARSEDIVQETYLRAVRAWRAKGVPDNALAWLRAVARNLLVSEARRHRPDADSERVETAAAGGGELSMEERMAMEQGLGSLHAGHASMLRAFHVEGRSMHEIAAREGISERAVEGRLRRAREALRAYLSPTTDTEESER